MHSAYATVVLIGRLGNIRQLSEFQGTNQLITLCIMCSCDENTRTLSCHYFRKSLYAVFSLSIGWQGHVKALVS
jgi:hypothetical protein